MIPVIMKKSRLVIAGAKRRVSSLMRHSPHKPGQAHILNPLYNKTNGEISHKSVADQSIIISTILPAFTG